MIALGLNISGYIASAALVRDGAVLAAAAEERFSRLKRDRAFPRQAIQWALADAGLTAADLDATAVAWNPARHLARNHHLLTEANRTRAHYLSYVPNALLSAFGGEAADEARQTLGGREFRYFDHHLAHAASACLAGPWDEGAFLTLDAFGEEDGLTWGVFDGTRIDPRGAVRFPHSVGSFYSAITEFLGFQTDADEYKVMALGAYADPDEGEALRRVLRRAFDLGSDGEAWRFTLDLGLFDFYLFHRARDFSPLARHLGLAPRRADEPLGPSHYALAWALQACFEEIVQETLRHVFRQTKQRRVALAGGCFMNSLANGKLEAMDAGFEAFFIPPAPDDSGAAVGAALLACRDDTAFRRHEQRHALWGPALDPRKIRAVLARAKLPFAVLDDPPARIAELIAQGRFVGHGAGRMEFGQRALGARSIFADPRRPDARDALNAAVKGREAFRPYAASVLAERVHELFEVPAGFAAPFMERVTRVRPAWRERLAGLLHADGTVRMHTVVEADNPRLCAILKNFERLTGVPALLNTSFNRAGEPIVQSAEDAVRCFYSCGLDDLVLEDCLLSKPSAAP